MSASMYDYLHTIWFERELLPKWAQLLDLAAKLSGATESDCKWFTRFGTSSGTDDARTIVKRCEALRSAIEARGVTLFTDLQNGGHDSQPAQIIGGWLYALDTMIQVARDSKTCSWTVECNDEVPSADWGGEGELRRL